MSRAPSDTRAARRIAIVTHSVFEEDPRIRREAEALTAAGWEVDVFALRGPGDPSAEALGIRTVPIDVGRHQGAGLGTYLVEYGSFLVRSSWALVRAQRRRHYRVVQVAAPPDPLVFAALPLRLVGVPIILDLHEATPEFFKSRFPRASNPLSDRLLHLAERVSIALARVVISVNQARHARLLALGYRPAKLRVVTNGPSLARFRPEAHPVRPFMADGTLRIVYTGAVTPLYELDMVVRAVARIRDQRPRLPVTFEIYGRGDAEPGLAELATELGIADRVVFHGRIPLEDIAAALAAVDIGVSPIRRDPFTEISMPTKALEYAVMGKPVVAADLTAARQQFDGPMLSWYEPGDAASLASALLHLLDDPDAREAGVAAAAERARELSWDREAPAYVALVESVAGITGA
jgi:glycosyltransferase involved in cell wall biosynthesis